MAESMLSEGEIPRGRGMLVPVLIAIALLAVGGAWFARVYLRPEVVAKAGPVQVFAYQSVSSAPAMTVGDRSFRVLGEKPASAQTEDVVYVIANVTLTDRSDVPLFIKAIDGTVTMEDGTIMQASAMQKTDLPRLLAMFPAMQPRVDAVATAPLLREGTIAPGATGNGYVIFMYNVSQAVWDKRKGSDVTIDFYHQDKVTLPLPK